MTDEEEFFAWLDGELAPADAARVAARVAQDPALAAQAESHRAIAHGLRAAFDPVMTPRSEVADLSARRAERVRRVPAGLPQWAAIAATLVAGFGLGSVVNTSRDDA
jgi:anti-sigma factor RsiW